MEERKRERETSLANSLKKKTKKKKTSKKNTNAIYNLTIGKAINATVYKVRVWPVQS